MRKGFLIALGVVAFAVTFVVVSIWAGRSMRELVAEPQLSADILTKNWIETPLSESISFVSPLPLEKKDLPLDPALQKKVVSQNSMQREQDGLTVLAAHIIYVPGTQVNLQGAADGSLARVRSMAGNQNVTSNKFDTWIIGAKALEFGAKIDRGGNVPLQMHGIVFGENAELYQVIMVCRADQERGDAVWDKLRSSIKKHA